MNNAKLIRIDDDAAVAALGEKYAKAFEFLRRPDLKDLPLGRQEIDGDRVYAIICENDLKPIGEVQRPEFHKRYVDVQAPITGTELFGVPDLPEEVANGPFDEKGDGALFDAKCPMQPVQPGECIIFEPFVAHAPCHTDVPGTRVRKAIVKVLYVAVKAKPECCSEQNRNGAREPVKRASARDFASKMAVVES